MESNYLGSPNRDLVTGHHTRVNRGDQSDTANPIIGSVVLIGEKRNTCRRKNYAPKSVLHYNLYLTRKDPCPSSLRESVQKLLINSTGQLFQSFLRPSNIGLTENCRLTFSSFI